MFSPYVTGNPFEASPWDLWDEGTVENIALSLGFDPGTGIAISQNALGSKS